ncbi:radical SAM enzyme (TIGR01210 family) [Methanolinea mesophila]|uniref:archaeosine biosynthesis radical SAM protein RaSEA n=1 Tax=Methanolinea mesophila TaxID=547055 RepID=UPI001AE6E9A4|nr:archaeosine biosynthesis radical SAM protein RaSEA [Methanolinea mesophila]MBP1927824.1 radical SAM enzyme (TIGR01210 family) [Methanolinea mesophila]
MSTSGPLEKPLASWRGKDRHREEILESLTVILRTGGCAWNRCRMCSYRHERYAPGTGRPLDALLCSQLAWIDANYDLAEVQMVKVYTSGSFFDPAEVPPPVWERAGKLFSGKVVIAETRPEYVREETVAAFRDAIDTGDWDRPFYVAMGLETTNDDIREKSIQKGFTMEDFRRAVGAARSGGAGVKAYLLHKPLFLTEREAVEDMNRSIREIEGLADIISMNPCSVQRRTELERYWKKGEYRPPYLWSVLAILLDSPVHVQCDPVGGGYSRGAHNCGACDKEITRGIRDYTLNGDRDLLANLFGQDCGCKKEWEFVMEHERPYCMPLTR